MPAKKPSSVKKPGRGKRPIGLTSAIGPKATTIVVICVMAGGIALAARQQQQAARAKDAAAAAAPLVSADAGESPSAPAKKPGVVRGVSASTSTPPVVHASVTTAANRATTITGCLERSDEGFRLKDTAGAEAPKSRSWKSGFLKKGSAAIEVVDPAHALPLASNVGRRVSVTGVLTDRQMRADGMVRVSPSCKAG